VSDPLGRWRCYTYDELIRRDKLSLELTWIPDDSLEDSASLPDPDEIAPRSSRISVRPWRSSRRSRPI
jgi:hypothetical protein